MSKHIFQHPAETETGPRYWRSLGQLADTPEFQSWAEREFPAGASELNPETSRRGFMKYMAASAALAGISLSACRREEKLLVPFSQGIEWSIPGKPLFYATSRPHRRGAHPVVVTTHDGRPTKVEGNPLHPASKGATDIHSQTSVLDLYDPDRSKRFLHEGVELDEKAFTEWLNKSVEEAAKVGGEGVAFLTEHSNSPTFGRLKEAVLKKLPKALWASYEPLGGEEARKANEAAFGLGYRPVPLIDKANIILSLDSDFLSFDEGRLEGISAFTARRKPESKDGMNRLYVVENRYTVTGGMADHRLRCPASRVAAVARHFAEYITTKINDAALIGLIGAMPKLPLPAGMDPKWIETAADDLLDAKNKGKALVLVGYRQPAAVQLIGHLINAALDAYATAEGKANLFSARQTGVAPTTGINEIADAIKDKKVKTLFILGGNPVYNAPADLKWSALQASVENVVRLGLYEDETSFSENTGNLEKRKWVKWHVPGTHYLESWGDGRSSDGSILSQQPMILPLYGGWSDIQLLNTIATDKMSDGLDLVQTTVELIGGGIDVKSWAQFLHDGFVTGSSALDEPAVIVPTGAEDLLKTYQPPKDGIELVFTPCPKVDDGRYANNGWLQELPDPISKLTWDNAAWVSPSTAKSLGIPEPEQVNGRKSPWISISVPGIVNDEPFKIPVYILPGHADNSISIALGYGRTFDGRVGGREGNYSSHGGLFAEKKPVGFDAYKLRTRDTQYFAAGVEVRVLKDDEYLLAVTQEHHAIEGRGPDIMREGTFEKYSENHGFAKDAEFLHEHLAMDAHAEARDEKNYPISRSAYTQPTLNDKNHQWGMAIDLAVCTGCSACMVACQSENNIPVVGKDQVMEGREMHWIRMDRYFVTNMNDRKEINGHGLDVDDARMVMQPMNCQHCENAPCETVCPVNATVHSEDGLNVMAYNRCIGTRYCANNCPFKVRRFNFFDFNERQKDRYFVPTLIDEKGMADSLKLSKNPNVTVRMRGVMEKCTFCVQRVQEAKITAKVKAKDSDNVQVPTDSFQVACQQACPSDAIVFGNMNDPKSSVSMTKDNPRDYRVYDYLGIKARVSYLARISNPNPLMPDAKRFGAGKSGGHA